MIIGTLKMFLGGLVVMNIMILIAFVLTIGMEGNKNMKGCDGVAVFFMFPAQKIVCMYWVD